MVAADAHVHVHPHADVGALLDAAATSFAALAHELRAIELHAALLLAEIDESRWFEQTRARGARVANDWRIAPDPADPATLRAVRGDVQIAIVAGRQIATREGIEVLALATTGRFRDGASLEDTLHQVAAAPEAIAVLPWGAGKWLGARGRRVRAVLRESLAGAPCVGDNSGRPAFWRDRDVLGADARRRLRVLPGSDPLPLPGEESRVGSFGFWVECESPWRRPADELRAILARTPPDALHAYGDPEPTWRFLRNQLALRLAAARAP